MTRFLPRVDARTQNNLLVSFGVAQVLGFIVVCWAALLHWDLGRFALLIEGRFQGLLAGLTLALWYLAEEGRTD